MTQPAISTNNTNPTIPSYQHIINGHAVNSDSHILSRNSSNLADVLGQFPVASKEQVREACNAAKIAFEQWRKTPAPVRGELIGQIGKVLEREKEALSQLLTREMGKTLKEARGDVQEAIDTAKPYPQRCPIKS
jgi:alpha-ketoglutaric semialdehyde dehydrogenase